MKVKTSITSTSSFTKRGFVAGALAAGATGMGRAAAAPTQTAGNGNAAVSTLTVSFPDDALADLRRRVVATRWPDKEQVPDTTQGVQLATMQALAQYWTTDYDWKKCEA